MKVLVCGVDGYLGWSLALHLAERGHAVAGVDNFARRKWVAEVGSDSAIPIAEMNGRLLGFLDRFDRQLAFYRGDLTSYAFTRSVLEETAPDAIVHFAEMPSAPYSMIDAEHAVYTHTNNLTGTLNLLFAMRDVCPEAHLVKLGTMGEYGTPNVDIPEGSFELEYRGRNDRLPFPRTPGSFYHATKVHDSVNIDLACRIWGLRSTDIMQGVVYGTQVDAMGEDSRLRTRFDFDGVFGTAINRFCVQAVLEAPLTLYGKGLQRRGFLPLRDSMQCITLILENPPDKGEYRVFNQFEEVYGLTELAQKVKTAALEFGLQPEIRCFENPRYEMEEHYYNPDHEGLLKLGYKPTRDMSSELHTVLEDLLPHRERLEQHREALVPDVQWSGEKRRARRL